MTPGLVEPDVEPDAPMPDIVEPDIVDPDEPIPDMPEPDMPEPDMPEPDMDPMPVALLVLLGPLTAEGEPAEFCMAPAEVPDVDAGPVDVACDGLAFMAPGPEVLTPPLAPEAAPAPELPAPAPMVWAPATVAKAITPPAIIAAALKLVDLVIATLPY